MVKALLDWWVGGWGSFFWERRVVVVRRMSFSLFGIGVDCG